MIVNFLKNFPISIQQCFEGQKFRAIPNSRIRVAANFTLPSPEGSPPMEGCIFISKLMEFNGTDETAQIRVTAGERDLPKPEFIFKFSKQKFTELSASVQGEPVKYKLAEGSDQEAIEQTCVSLFENFLNHPTEAPDIPSSLELGLVRA